MAADDTVRCCCSRAVSDAASPLRADVALFPTTCRWGAVGFSLFCLEGGSSCDGRHRENEADSFHQRLIVLVGSGPLACSCCKGIFVHSLWAICSIQFWMFFLSKQTFLSLFKMHAFMLDCFWVQLSIAATVLTPSLLPLWKWKFKRAISSIPGPDFFWWDNFLWCQRWHWGKKYHCRGSARRIVHKNGNKWRN